MLPPIEGWSWYDALSIYSPNDTRAFEEAWKIKSGLSDYRSKNTVYNDQLSTKGNTMRPDSTINQSEVCGSAVLITAQNIKKLAIINGGQKFKGKKQFLKKDYYFFLPDDSLAFTDTLAAKEFFKRYEFVGYPDSHCLQAVTAIQL